MKRNALLLIRQFFQTLFIIMPNACPEAIDIGAFLRDEVRNKHNVQTNGS